MAPSVLIVGYNSRVAACSARCAGYTVYSLGHHEDVDLLGCVDRHVTFDQEPADLRPYLEEFDADYVVLGSGFEDVDLPASKVLGNDPKVARNVVNKVWFARKLEELGVPQPELFDRGRIRFPCIAKPIKGGGGHKNFTVHDESMLPPEDEYFLQELVTGRPLSVCTFSTGSEAVPATLNEVLVGTRWLGQELRYAYCGNVTPYITKFRDQMYEIAKKLMPELGLVGTNGIDFIVNRDGPKVLEVNPRFQGSLDSVELATGENVFQAHVDAINGKLRPFKVRRFGVRAIDFARRETRVTGDLMSPVTADVPPAGRVFHKGDAIVTVLGEGPTRGEAMAKMKGNLRWVRGRLRAHRQGGPIP